MWPGQISLGLFRDLQVERSNFWSVWPSSIGHVPRGIMILLSMRSCYYVGQDLHYCVISSIAFYVIVWIHRSWFMRLCWFSRSRVRTPDRTVRIFYWSWVRFPGQIACFRPVWSVAYVTVWQWLWTITNFIQFDIQGFMQMEVIILTSESNIITVNCTCNKWIN